MDLPVRGRLPNPWGLHDVHGNVREWVEDEGYRPYDAGPTTDPVLHDGGGWRLMRGGSYRNDADRCRSAFRSLWFGWAPAPGRQWSLDP